MTCPQEKIDVIYDLIDMVLSYNKIFGFRDNGVHSDEPLLKEETLIENVDTMITSIGSSDTTFSHNDDDLIKAGRIKREDLRDTLIGDISGVPIPRSNLNDKGQEIFNGLINHWTGIKEYHLKKCAEDASKKDNIGVIAIGIGAIKARVMYECISRGFVNHAIIDQDLAKALVNL